MESAPSARHENPTRRAGSYWESSASMASRTSPVVLSVRFMCPVMPILIVLLSRCELVPQLDGRGNGRVSCGLHQEAPVVVVDARGLYRRCGVDCLPGVDAGGLGLAGGEVDERRVPQIQGVAAREGPGEARGPLCRVDRVRAVPGEVEALGDPPVQPCPAYVGDPLGGAGPVGTVHVLLRGDDQPSDLGGVAGEGVAVR